MVKQLKREFPIRLHECTEQSTLNELILVGTNFGGFGGIGKNPPTSAKISSRQT